MMAHASWSRAHRRVTHLIERQKYEHRLVGVNSRLDTLEAVVLRAKLRRLAEWNEQRRAAAARYDERLADVDGVMLPTVLGGNVPIHYLYVVEVDGRDRE